VQVSVTSPRSRKAHCGKHASARFRPLVPADPHWDRRFCTSGLVDYDPSATAASDGSIHRYYDPATGQFLSVDPLIDETGQPYDYTGDDPSNARDPLGLWCPLGTNPGGGCRGGAEVKSVVNSVAPFVDRAKDQLADTLEISSTVAGAVQDGADVVTVVCLAGCEIAWLGTVPISEAAGNIATGSVCAAALLGRSFDNCLISIQIQIYSGGMSSGPALNALRDLWGWVVGTGASATTPNSTCRPN
jgi:RHS repeat-associated protein